ncbi:pilus assembly protein N-terminal domain-containing protein [Myxococcota bacterium]|nr:pilus assembly protein N-terminal domain-containing protein [Myxococcota bacterium]MBU1537597.1 pilus assembly protein N-terminal domain-containing protein [Myxococcota bacterium]
MKKLILLPIILVSAFISMGSTAAWGQGKTISLSVGSSETIKFDNRITGVIRILNDRIADVVSFSKRSVTVVGIAKGVTDLYVPVGRETIRIRIDVSDVKVGKTVRAVNLFLGGPEGIYTQAVDTKIVISGTAYTAADYGRVMKAIEIFGKDKVVNYTKYRPSAVEQINKTLQAAGMTSVKANLVAGSVFLEGAVGSKNEMEKLKAIIDALHVKVSNLVSMGEGAQVQVKVRFMEISHSDMVNFGLELPDALVVSGGLEGEFPILPAGQTNQLTFMARSPEALLNFKLNTLFKTGNARILAEPKLVCGSGSEASLQVGGQIPIPMITSTTSSVEWKDFGIILKLKPVANSRGNITIALQSEVSDVDWAIAVQGIPGFKTRKVKTTVTMKAGSTLIISGLYKNNRSKNIKKFPLLGHIPILGELFKSRQYQEERTSLAIMLTPTLVSSEQLKMKESIQLVESKFLDFNKYLYWDLFLE